jgi:hypothetical protein
MIGKNTLTKDTDTLMMGKKMLSAKNKIAKDVGACL